jgi:hypothetical protein
METIDATPTAAKRQAAAIRNRDAERFLGRIGRAGSIGEVLR